MYPDQKMSTEDAASEALKLFESIANTLDKFSRLDVKLTPASTSTSESGFYARYNKSDSAGEASSATKKEQFAANLGLIRGAQEELEQAIQESAERKLIFPGSPSF